MLLFFVVVVRHKYKKTNVQVQNDDGTSTRQGVQVQDKDCEKGLDIEQKNKTNMQFDKKILTDAE